MERGRISYLDSGASNHMTPDRHRFVDFAPATGQIRIGKGHLEVKGKETIVVKMVKSCGGWTLILIRQLAKKGVTTVCTKDEAVRTHDDGDVVFNSNVGDDVYYLETIPFERHMANVPVENNQQEPGHNDEDIEVIEANAYKSIASWHERLGHLHGNAMRKIPIRSVKEDSKKHDELYGVSMKRKMTKVPFPRTAHHMCQRPLEIVHSHISRRVQCKSLGGGNYFVTFIDDFCRFMYVRIISRKSEIFKCVKEYQMGVKALHQSKISALQIDNVGEYTGINFKSYLREKDILHRKTVSRNPEQNGNLERANRTLVEMSRCLLIQSRLPNYLWGESTNTACHIRNLYAHPPLSEIKFH